MILRSFYNGAFSIASKHDFDDQFFLLATVLQVYFPQNLNVSALFNCKEKMKRGKTFIKIISSKVNLDPELISYNFENIFNGDKQLGDNINWVIKDNWKEVFDGVKDGYVEVINRIFLELFNNFFSTVSLENAFD
jgi:hypothetical protein